MINTRSNNIFSGERKEHPDKYVPSYANVALNAISASLAKLVADVQTQKK